MAVNVPIIEVGTGNQTKVISPVFLTAIGPTGQPHPLRVSTSGALKLLNPAVRAQMHWRELR